MNEIYNAKETISENPILYFIQNCIRLHMATMPLNTTIPICGTYYQNIKKIWWYRNA